MTNNYDASQIQVLKGLEGVRRRPAMYIGDVGMRGLHHLVVEIVDNSIDEAMAGVCKHITVTLEEPNRVSVEDDGRGIPVDVHPELGLPGLEVAMTVLHAGAKFSGKVYIISGGLHGVGASVVNALSEWMEVEVYQHGKIYVQSYEKGVTTGPIQIKGNTKKTGTKTTFIPDPTIFKRTSFNPEIIATRLREVAYLNPDLAIKLADKVKGTEQVFAFKRGIVDFLAYLDQGRIRLHKPLYFRDSRNGIEVETAIEYTDSFAENIVTFVNTINTHEGGTHLVGFKAALTKTLNEAARKSNSKGKAIDLTGEDVREGLTAIISVRMRNPQFEGQTKTKLGNSEVRGVVESIVSEGLSSHFDEQPRVLNLILQKTTSAARLREAARKARELERKKSLLASDTLPGKLADCSSDNPDECELFIVEGNSAGGSAKQGRDRRFQAVLALRGKILNVEKSGLNKILANTEIKAIISSVGTGFGEESFDDSRVRYSKIIIMADADVDGSHIRTLLLTLFYRHMRDLIEQGMIYIAQPPLYRIKKGKKEAYLYSEEELEAFRKDESHPERLEVQRFKGLGEMNPEQLWETTMNPEKRILKKISVADAAEAHKVFSVLMGSEVAPRREFIEENAQFVENLDI
ncbi:DNA topoisomerase (ATP-hydrolyzing) subunit B [candidate division TA06 bacterium B3_TA06]|uniref:DNA gyrase subunit B n=1 Tax=candidate division TA06 bacterium B3_TA06 TaxID=2012487 RepID=A0A532V970_UNCT6|nr:MAG: DNA topoisomerase (ATP-hydrolyzing) subunit B [candidate division TA06 bacterium B3_TA06]